MNKQKGKLLVVSGPSGCGKGTVLKKVLKENSNIYYSVSATTRAPRYGEENGIHYYFITKEEFEKKISEGGMLEYAEYVGNYYGTPKDIVLAKLEKGYDVILEIEVKGAMQIRKAVPEAILVFIAPPSMEELEKRLIGRGTEKLDVIKSRLKKAEKEMQYQNEYDYLVINDEISIAAEEIAAILKSEKLKINKN
ncbi:MAG: guanylate kinase [Oscillospiraceae bacterium]|nr:guanylate kinase [Oscillospiraceae bacterium]